MRRYSVKKRALSVMLTLALLIAYFPVMDAVIPTVAAETATPVQALDISSGNITITSTGYKVDDVVTNFTGSYTITGTSSKLNTIVIDGYSGTINLSSLQIDQDRQAPILIKNSSNVNLVINGTCVLRNSATSSTNPYTWPAVCVGDGTNTVNITGTGTLNATGGKYNPAIGGYCSDDGDFVGARTSTFNSTITFDGPIVTAEGGAGAPNIGTGRGCNVTGGEIIFKSGKITATKTSSNSVGIGLCEDTSIQESTYIDAASLSNKLTLRFTGAAITAAGGLYGAAIGAGRGQNGYRVYISDGAVTATGGSNSPAIGGGDKSSSIELVEITGGIVELTAGSSAPAIGDGANIATATSRIDISGGTLTAVSNSTAITGTSPIRGVVNTNNYTDMSLELNYTEKLPTDEPVVKIPYAEHTMANYITTGFASTSGTYYKTVAPTITTASRGKTCKYIKISTCTAHTNDFAADATDENRTHTVICHYCNHKSANEQHVWKYTASGQTITQKCDGCGLEHHITIEDATLPYDKSAHPVKEVVNDIVGTLTYEYSSDGASFNATVPVEAGTYTARVTIGDVSITAKVVIDPIAMDITANSVEHEYDGTGYNIGVTVNSPDGALVEFSTDGVNYTQDIPKFTNVGKHMCYYKVSCESYTPVVGIKYVTITPKPITGLTITGVDQPNGGVALDEDSLCETTGIASRTPLVYWLYEDGTEATGNAKYNTNYECYITIYPDATGYSLSIADNNTSAVTINGNDCISVKSNPDGSVTARARFTTAKAKVTEVKAPAKRTGIAHGARNNAEELGLPATVEVTCEDPAITSLSVNWQTSADGYIPSAETEQNFNVTGIVSVPEALNATAVENAGIVTVTVAVQVLAATVADIGVDVEAGIYAEDQLLHLTTETNGAKIYYTTDGNVPTEMSTLYDPATGIPLTGTEGSKTKYNIRACAFKTGLYCSNVVNLEYTINKSDATPPTAEITIASKTWDSFWSAVTFGLFSTEKREVTIAYDDVGSGIEGQFYYIATDEMTKADLDACKDWLTYTTSFEISDVGKYIVYAKAVDAEDNVTYVNSNGVVIYKNSTANTKQINVIPNVDQYVDFYVNLNGNTIDKIELQDATVDSNLYTVNEINGMVTLNHDAFDGLSYGQYTITVYYKPQGESYFADFDNVEPLTTTLTMNAVKPKLLSITQPSPVSDVPNGTSLADMVNYIPSYAYITTEDPNILTAPILWKLDAVYSGSYSADVLEAQDFTLQGTVQLSDGVNRNNIVTTVYVSVSVKAANQLSKPIASVNAGRYANSVTISLSSSDAADIYYTLDGSIPTTSSDRYTQPITLTETKTLKAICHTDGMYDSNMLSATYIITQMDTTAPAGTIAVGTESLWDALWSGTLFQFFTKKSQVVTISGDDQESGIQAIFYYISPKELTYEELEQVTGWELYEESLHLDPNVGGIIYAKIINNDDLYTYVNSNGIVVYTDAERVTDSVTYVKGTNNDVEFTVKLNGNSIKAVRNGSTSLSPAQYSQSSDGNVVISASYLEALSTGNYIFYVDYYPLGINNSNATGHSVAPASTSLQVLISAKSTSQGSGTGSNQGGSSSSGSGVIIPPGSTSQNPDFEGSTKPGTITTTDSNGVKHTITTVTYTDKSKTVTDESTGKDGTKTVIVTERDATGATTNVATKIVTKDGTETYTVVEYVSSTQTKSTTNKVDKLGNSYSRVYVTNKDGSSKETITSVISDVKTTDNYSVSTSGKITQTYKTTKELNGDTVSITVKGSGSQTSPKYAETYKLVEDGLDKCTVSVTRTNSKASATASVVKTNEAGNKVTINSELLDDMATAASWNDPNGELPNVSTVHSFSSSREPVDGIDVTYKVLNDAGDKRYTLMFDSNDIVPGAKIRQFRYTGSKYVMLGSKYKTVTDGGNLSISPSKNYTYLLAGPSTYKSVNNKIKASAVFSPSSAATVTKGKSQYFKLSSKFNSMNIKSISYKSKNNLVATVATNGKVTAKRKGKTTITATIKFVNGGSKTITRTVNVK